MSEPIEHYIDVRSVDQSMYNEATGDAGEGVQDTVYRIWYTVTSTCIGRDTGGVPLYQHMSEILRCETEQIVGCGTDANGSPVAIREWLPDQLSNAMRAAAYELIDRALDDEEAKMQAEMFEEQE